MVQFNDGMLRRIGGVRGSRPTALATDVRNEMKTYVNSMEGALPWQWDHVRSHGNINEGLVFFQLDI